MCWCCEGDALEVPGDAMDVRRGCGAMKVRENLTSISVVRYETYEYAL